MSTRINRVPLGLLDFLGTKSLGDNPSELMAEVRPTLNLFPFFAAERFVVNGENASASTGAGGQTFTVPKGELWLMVSAMFRMRVSNSNDVADLAIIHRNPIGGVFGAANATEATLVRRNFTLDYPSGTTVGQDLSVTYTFPYPLAFGTDHDLVFRWEEGTITTSTPFVSVFNYFRYQT